MEGFTACLWEVASLAQPELDAISVQVASHADGAVVIESCQRREVYSVGECSCSAPSRLRGIEALRHLSEVAAGLDSIVLGEEQVMGQVRSAFSGAAPRIRALSDHAVGAARELRRVTEFNSHSGYLLDQGLKDAGIEADGTLLVIGTGHMARLVARRGQALGFDDIVISGRTKPEGSWFKEANFAWSPLVTLSRTEPVEVAVGCLGADAGQLATQDALPSVTSLILDLGSPLNFAHDGDGAPFLTIADLMGTDRARQHRDEKRSPLQAILHGALDKRISMAQTDGRSSVGALRATVEEIRQRELARMKRLHPEIPEETLEAITKSLVSQIFHLPSARLKSMTDDEMARAFVELFEPEAEDAALGATG